ncbi:D-amino-acid transaminase [Oceanobacillus kimchii]|uniref:D-amino-acid transaminase n=1 Tax=Oceanobacillus TaxID=182709 RepID=UPI00034BEE47|nr:MULTISPECIES: D-amino-acid transaminase [Oceanobacillus]MCT1578593.1 D-amino-acid transaminase [Oceanobacillus kimchii]MCT2136358.1 D-amino-acid transaminase [Oceanobacillus kimchii]OEH54232.1 D-alanine aminotransferase [Oceanobacillus sp. E9]
MSVYPIILTQSEFRDKDSLNYPFEERGLQFGDGIYEVIRVYEGKYYLFEEHVDRLYRSAEAIKIEIPQSKKEMKELLLQLITKNEMTTDGKVYMQITRGSAPRDHIFPQSVEPNMYAYIQDMPRNKEALQHGVSTITQPDIRWENCYIKSLNLLPNVLAKQTAKEQGCYEAILHRDGKVTECSSSNVYLVKNGKVYTHPTTNNILYGCVRMAVERFLKDADIELIEDAFQLEDISNADEIFLSSSTSEVTPIVRVDDKAIGDGKPGTITKQLQHAYESDAAIQDKLSV